MSPIAMIVVSLGLWLGGQGGPGGGGVAFREGFEDAGLLGRGWYDAEDRFVLADDAAVGRRSIRYHFPKGELTPADSAGARLPVGPTEVVYLRFYLKLSEGWEWTGRPYGPHLMYFMTTENGKYHGPAASRLTVYVEPHGGKLRLATQDIQNAGSPRGTTQGPLRGGYNGRFHDSREGVLEAGRWHCVEAMFRLNSLDAATGEANPDGELRGWVDGELVVERDDVVFRSGDYPGMKFNQFLMAAYFHHGVPRDQTLWIDDLAIGTERIGPAEAEAGDGAGGP